MPRSDLPTPGQIVSAGTDTRRWSYDHEPNLVLWQAQRQGPVRHAALPGSEQAWNVSIQALKVLLGGLVFFTQEQLSEEETTDSQAGQRHRGHGDTHAGKAYCWAIGAACDAALLECAQGTFRLMILWCLRWT